jgi:hypothetical protein
MHHCAYWMITWKTWCLPITPYKVGKNQNRYKNKYEREEKHWEVKNSDMTLFHKKDGKLWFSYI